MCFSAPQQMTSCQLPPPLSRQGGWHKVFHSMGRSTCPPSCRPTMACCALASAASHCSAASRGGQVCLALRGGGGHPALRRAPLRCAPLTRPARSSTGPARRPGRRARSAARRRSPWPPGRRAGPADDRGGRVGGPRQAAGRGAARGGRIRQAARGGPGLGARRCHAARGRAGQRARCGQGKRQGAAGPARRPGRRAGPGCMEVCSPHQCGFGLCLKRTRCEVDMGSMRRLHWPLALTQRRLARRLSTLIWVESVERPAGALSAGSISCRAQCPPCRMCPSSDSRH